MFFAPCEIRKISRQLQTPGSTGDLSRRRQTTKGMRDKRAHLSLVTFVTRRFRLEPLPESCLLFFFCVCAGESFRTQISAGVKERAILYLVINSVVVRRTTAMGAVKSRAALSPSLHNHVGFCERTPPDFAGKWH